MLWGPLQYNTPHWIMSLLQLFWNFPDKFLAKWSYQKVEYKNNVQKST